MIATSALRLPTLYWCGLALSSGLIGAGISWWNQGSVPAPTPFENLALATNPGSRSEPRASSAFASTARGAASTAFSEAWELNRLIAPPTSPGPPKPSIWRIAGLTQVGDERRALVVFDGANAPELKKPGDVLPGGAKIVAIDSTSVELLVGGKKVFVMTGQP